MQKWETSPKAFSFQCMAEFTTNKKKKKKRKKNAFTAIPTRIFDWLTGGLQPNQVDTYNWPPHSPISFYHLPSAHHSYEITMRLILPGPVQCSSPASSLIPPVSCPTTPDYSKLLPGLGPGYSCMSGCGQCTDHTEHFLGKRTGLLQYRWKGKGCHATV